VQNGLNSLVATPVEAARSAAPVARLPMLEVDVWSREGMDDTGWATRVETDATGSRTLRASRGQRVELFLDPMLMARCGTWEGHLITSDVAGPLPPGASLDERTGVFRWQPMPQFRGAFTFVFVRRGCDGKERRLPIGVVIDL
jgi:hypothetical protein